MTKKLTAYIHILIANILLLAFVVIPHHHHNTEVCFMSSHCQSNIEANNHNETHQHDGSDSNGDNCILVNAAFIPTYLNKSSLELNIAEKSVLTSTFFDISIFNYIAKATECSVSVFFPPSVNTFSSHIKASLGLRAPPTV